MLKIAWEGELFGVGMFETLAEMYPDHADEFTACATLEWFNVHYCEPFGHAAGMHVTLERAEKLGREGAAFARHIHSFDGVAKVGIEETKEADEIYKQLSKRAGSPELKVLGEDLLAHENALRDWMQAAASASSSARAAPAVGRTPAHRRRGLPRLRCR